MKTVFFDVDTQLDFISPAGALYVAGAEEIAPIVAKLTRFASQHEIPIVSTLDTHAEDDPEFKIWKPHCVSGTQGQQKCSQSLMERNSGLQIMFEKNIIDFFPNAELDGILDRLRADRFVVYGLVTEYCIRATIFALLARKVRVEAVTDAIRGINSSAAETVLGEFQASGGHLTTAPALQ